MLLTRLAELAVRNGDFRYKGFLDGRMIYMMRRKTQSTSE